MMRGAPGAAALAACLVVAAAALGYGGEALADSSPPMITLNGGAEFRLGIGTGYSDPGAACVDASEGDITHRLNVSGHDIDSSAPGTHTVKYVCKDSANNVADPMSRTVIVVDDLRLVVNSTRFVDSERGLPSATCTGAGEPRRIEGAVKPPFDPERQFTFEDRGVAHVSNFTCTDGLTYLVTNSTRFTHAHQYPVISIPGYEGDNLGEFESSKLRNLRVVGSAYTNDAAICYHYKFGEVGPAAIQFNITSPITPDTKFGIYPATYICGATNSTGDELFDIRSREIPLAARLAPEIEADDVDHLLGEAFADRAVCRGLFNNTIPHTLSVTDRLGSAVEIGPATPLGTYDALYTCRQQYLGGTFTAEPASPQIHVVPHGRARIHIEGDGRVLERGQDDLPTARCVDLQAGTSVPVTDFVVEPPFDIAEEFTFERRAKEHVITFSCAGTDGVPVTEAAGFTQVGARPVISTTMFTEAPDGRWVSDTDAFWLRDAEYENPRRQVLPPHDRRGGPGRRRPVHREDEHHGGDAVRDPPGHIRLHGPELPAWRGKGVADEARDCGRAGPSPDNPVPRDQAHAALRVRRDRHVQGNL